jgi:hypothetical protein
MPVDTAIRKASVVAIPPSGKRVSRWRQVFAMRFAAIPEFRQQHGDKSDSQDGVSVCENPIEDEPWAMGWYPVRINTDRLHDEGETSYQYGESHSAGRYVSGAAPPRKAS